MIGNSQRAPRVVTIAKRLQPEPFHMTARIYRPAKTATQSGSARTKQWVLEFEPESPREIDPLMGWTSSSDMKSQVRLRFGDKDEAVAYAQKHGLAYRVEEPKPDQRKILSYSDNFKSTRLGQWTH
ncbi:ETC complex I subunit conserved region [Methylocella tundrae]|uniref:ETC complex I subunit conserved region n=2 Tax=Methylocella tundrae TaxID=227605 RepID=A0A4U8YYA6_METTU|nr:ETC complex I subunit conserved region [Methylocella tundrae]